ncbi:MAG: hypothetical protein ACJA1C_003381 [Crocinitomicaceae bacterium]|jgi:hypothetical protein
MRSYLLVALTYITPLILIIGIIGGIVTFNRMEKKYRLLLLYLIVALVFDISGRLFGYFFKYNLFLIPLYGFAELIVFCYIFTIKRAYFLAVVTIASLLVGYEIISIDPLDTSGFNSYSKVFSNFSILLMAFLSYYRVLEQEKMIEKKILIFNSLTFIYFALSLILYIPLNFLISKDSDLPFYFWNLNLIITSSFYAYISYLIWNSGKHLKQSPLG